MIKPLGERVVIEVAEGDVKTASGIVLPDTAKEKPQKGTVIAVGAGKVLDNESALLWKLKLATKLSSPNIPARKSKLTTKNI